MKKVYISGRISDLPREQYMTMFGIAGQTVKLNKRLAKLQEKWNKNNMTKTE